VLLDTDTNLKIIVNYFVFKTFRIWIELGGTLTTKLRGYIYG
jgi:hypothetical protein